MTVSDTVLLEQRREAILDAARENFAEKGFTATTMAHIAKRVGMSVGNLYNYFPGKDAILNALAQKESNEKGEYARRFIRGEISLSEQRANLIAHIKDRMTPAQARVTLEVFVEATHNEKIAQIVHRFDEEVRDFLTEIYIKAGLDKDQIKAKIAVDMVLMDGIMIRTLAQSDLDVDFVAPIIADQILALR